MTLDQAIDRFTNNAEYERIHGSLQGCLEFRQYAEWLKDYKRLLEQQPTEDMPCVTAEEMQKCKDIVKKYTPKQQPCDDAISRRAVLDGLASIAKVKAKSDAQKSLMGRVMFFVEKLPPVTPQQKYGKWILADEQNKEDVENDNYRFICSECQCSDIHAKGTIVPYCWKCGAKMQESEDKEK